MTTKLEQAARQALEAWDNMNSGYCTTEFNALREALAEQEKPLYRKVLREMLDAHEQAEQEPVAWVNADNLDNLLNDRTTTIQGNRSFFRATPLYAAPVRTKDLTDDEAQKLWNDTSSIVPMWAHHLHFARAVIAADREKNK